MVAALAGCYSPHTYGHCEINCDFANSGVCPGDLQCGENNRCFDPGIGKCDNANADATPSQNCYGVDDPPFARVCVDNPPDTYLFSLSIDTTLGSSDCMNPTGVDDAYCLIYARTLVVEDLKVRGKRPLVLIGTTSLTVKDGKTIGAAGVTGDTTTPPAANGCIGASGTAGVGGGGGAGGAAFGNAGGNGGSGTAGVGGTAVSISSTTAIRGGCQGGVGGTSVPNGTRGGNGGGAVYLLGGGMVTVDGTVNVSGAGGSASPAQSGGSGGGSGGMILLWSGGTISIGSAAKLMAMGGSGGSGGGGAQAGSSGKDPDTLGQAVVGGVGGGAAGGNGASRTLAGTAGGGSSSAAGGGGGGSVGLIKTKPAIDTVSRARFDPFPQ